MAYINKQDTDGSKPALQEGELGYDKQGTDRGRVYVGTDSGNRALAEKDEVIVNSDAITALDTRVSTNKTDIATNVSDILDRAKTSDVDTKNNSQDADIATKADQTELDTYLPIGTIVMFSKVKGLIPSGWYVCDGLNGTIDLTDRFIFSATTDAEVGVFGGSNDSVNIDHTHQHTDGGHSHSYTKVNNSTAFTVGGTPQSDAYVTTVGVGTSSSTSNISISNSGVSGVGLNRPSFARLFFIQKID